MSYSEDQVDELLQASAEHWRASLPVPTEPDVAGLVRRRRRRTAWPYPAAAGLAAVVVSVAVLALVVGSLYGVFGPARPSPSPVASAPTASITPIPTSNLVAPVLPQVLYLENRGGPPFTVRINGSDILTVECGGYPTVTAGQGNVPKLPWDLQIVRVADGTSLVSGQVTELPRWFLQMGGESLGLGGVLPLGPAGPSCPPPATPTPIVTPVPTPTCCATFSTPVPGETLAESNAFWNYWADRPFPRPRPDATSLEDAVSLSDLVIRGHIVDIYIGEYQWTNGTPVPVIYVKVAVNELFKGSPVSRTAGYVEIGLGSLDAAEVDQLRAALPQHDNIWFLKYDPGPSTSSDIAPYAYLMLNDQQGVLRDINGKVRLVKPQYLEPLGADHFPLPLEGTSFASLTEQMRAIAGSG